MTGKFALLAPLFVAAVAGPVAAAERMTILVLPGQAGDAALAENVTEVVIARVAETRRAELAGTAEFRARLGSESPQRITDCLDQIPCLGRVAVSMGVSRIISGTVRSRVSSW